MKTLTRPLLVTLILGAFLVGGARISAQASAAASQSSPAPVMRSWLIKLIPPRPTFAQDATKEELAVMQQHYLYWKNLSEKGVCVFGGPVLDPSGVYGILAVRAASEDEARALGNGDPSVKAGINKIEVAEMKIVFPPPGH